MPFYPNIHSPQTTTTFSPSIPTPGTSLPEGAMAQPLDKDLTCWYWAVQGECMFSERACLYSHYHTGRLADKHRSKAARGMFFGALRASGRSSIADGFDVGAATTAAGRHFREAQRREMGMLGTFGVDRPAVVYAAQGMGGLDDGALFQGQVVPAILGQPQGGFPALTKGNLAAHTQGGGPFNTDFKPPPQPQSYVPSGPKGTPGQGALPLHMRSSSSTLPKGELPVNHSHDIPGRRTLPTGKNYHQKHSGGAWSADWNGPFPKFKARHNRRMSTLNPNAQVFQAGLTTGENFKGQGSSSALPPKEEAAAHGPNLQQQAPIAPSRTPMLRRHAATTSGSSLTPTQRPSNIAPKTVEPGLQVAMLPEYALDIDVDDFAMESLDRKGKGRTLSNMSNSRPNFAMQGSLAGPTFEERANRYTMIIQREIDTRPPRSIELPNLLWRLGIRLPQTGILPPLPPQIEELWARRDSINCNLKGAETWMRLFNEDVFHMRISNDPQATAYARWGEQYVAQIIGFDIPQWTLEMRGTEEAMIAVMKGEAIKDC